MRPVFTGVKSTNLAVVDELESAYSAASIFSGKSSSKKAEQLVRTILPAHVDDSQVFRAITDGVLSAIPG
jgi:hypothetical protein